MNKEIKTSRLIFNAAVILPVIYFPATLLPAIIAGFLGWMLFFLFSKNRNELLASTSLIVSISIYAAYFKPAVGTAESLGLIVYCFISGVSMIYLVFKALGINGSLKAKAS